MKIIPKQTARLSDNKKREEQIIRSLIGNNLERNLFLDKIESLEHEKKRILEEWEKNKNCKKNYLWIIVFLLTILVIFIGFLLKKNKKVKNL